MTLKSVSKWLKLIIVLLGLCCFGIHSVVTIIFLASQADGIDPYRVPWIIFTWTTAVPVVPALIFSWSTALNIGKEKAFSRDNAKNLHKIALCSGADSIIVLLGNIILLLMNVNHPGVFLCSLIIVLIGVAILICAEGLSQLISRAAGLQEENDLTI